MDDDGSELLTSQRIGALLQAAIEHAGGRLLQWRMDHVDAHPQHSTTATYSAEVEWDFGRRTELLGVSARVGGPAPSDERADIFADGNRQVAVWLYPHDPDLPGLVRAAYPESLAQLLNEERILPHRITPAQVRLDMISYRPRRRAVLRAQIELGLEQRTLYIKVMQPQAQPDTIVRHRLLLDAGLPAPRIATSTDDGLLILEQVPGTALSKALFDDVDPCTGEQLVSLLDALPAQVAELPRRPPWSDAVDHYAQMVIEVAPTLQRPLLWMRDHIVDGLSGLTLGVEPTHGDFHEGQVHVAQGRITGILDIDTLGPGRRADDLACLIAHLSTVQRMTPQQAARVRHLISSWVPVFDRRVDATELRLRAAAVIISLATGPYRGQEPDWQAETAAIVGAAETLVRQVS